MGGALAPILGFGLGLMQMNEQDQAQQQAVQAQDVLNEAMRNVVNEQLALWQSKYKPLETSTVDIAQRMTTGIPFYNIASDVLSGLMQPYQVPEQLRTKMLENLRTQEARTQADLIRTLTSQGITGGQLAGALKNLQEQFIPARYGLERDLSIYGAEKQDAQRQQALQNAMSIFSNLEALGQSGRAIPGWATSTLGNMANQYAGMGSQPQSSNLYSLLGTSLANLTQKPSATTPSTSTAYNPYGFSSIPSTWVDIAPTYTPPIMA